MVTSFEKVKLTHKQWATLIGFLGAQRNTIKEMLSANMHPDMIMSNLVLTNIREEKPLISAELIYPTDQDRLVLQTIPRPISFSLQSITDIIRRITIDDIALFVANQIECV